MYNNMYCEHPRHASSPLAAVANPLAVAVRQFRHPRRANINLFNIGCSIFFVGYAYVNGYRRFSAIFSYLFWWIYYRFKLNGRDHKEGHEDGGWTVLSHEQGLNAM